MAEHFSRGSIKRYAQIALGLESDESSVFRKKRLEALRIAAHVAADHFLARRSTHAKSYVFGETIRTPKGECSHFGSSFIRALSDEGIAGVQRFREMAYQRSKKIAARNGGRSLRDNSQGFFRVANVFVHG